MNTKIFKMITHTHTMLLWKYILSILCVIYSQFKWYKTVYNTELNNESFSNSSHMVYMLWCFFLNSKWYSAKNNNSFYGKIDSPFVFFFLHVFLKIRLLLYSHNKTKVETFYFYFDRIRYDIQHAGQWTYINKTVRI